MPRNEIAEAVQNTAGAAISGATVQLNDLLGNPLVHYSADSGGSSSTGTFTTDSAGRMERYVEAPDFDVVVTKSGYTSYTQRIRNSPAGLYDARSYGVRADGTTNDSTAWVALAALLPDGALVTWSGNSLVTRDALQLIGRLNLAGQGLRSALTITGTSAVLDGLVVGGTDGPRYGHILRDFSILGGAGCCRHALVLRNLIDPTIQNVKVKAGATYGVSIEGVQNVKRGACTIAVSNNTSYAYAGTAPTNGVRIVGSALIPTNACHFDFDVEALTGIGLLGDATVGMAGSNNNYLRGVFQGNGGKGVHLKQWTDGSLSDAHIEGNTGDDLTLEGCQRFDLGSPRVFVDGNTKLIDCDDIALDLTTTDYSADSACTIVDRDHLYVNGGTNSDSSWAAWKAPPADAAWQDYPSGSLEEAGYRRRADVVEFRGQIQVLITPLPRTLFTLPVGFRPPETLIFREGPKEIRVNSSGTVVAQSETDAVNLWSLEIVRYSVSA